MMDGKIVKRSVKSDNLITDDLGVYIWVWTSTALGPDMEVENCLALASIYGNIKNKNSARKLCTALNYSVHLI